MGSNEIAAKVLTTFGVTSPRDIEILVECVKKGDAKGVANAAHKIKGSAANISAEGIRRVASEIEELARADALSQTEECLGRLKDEMDELRGYLGTALDKLAVTPTTSSSFAGRQSALPASAAVQRLPA